MLAVALGGCESAAPPDGAPLAAATRIPRPSPTPRSNPQRPSGRQSGPLSGLVRVDAGDDWFLPEVVTVTAGTTVRWVHVGDEAHNAFAIDGSWGTPDFGIGAQAEVQFQQPGRFEYLCTRHAPGMRGVIVVVPR